MRPQEAPAASTPSHKPPPCLLGCPLLPQAPTAPGLSLPRCPTCPPSCGQRWAARCRRPTHTCQGRGRGDRTPVTKDTAGQLQDTRPAPAAVLSLCDRQLHPPVGLAALQWADFGEVKWRADLVRNERLPAARHLRACMGQAALGGSACMQVAHCNSRGSGHHSNLPHPAGHPASCCSTHHWPPADRWWRGAGRRGQARCPAQSRL